jgi:hypothetical protein
VPDHEAVAELVAEVAQMGQALDGLVADQRRHAADLHRRLNSARESQAQLEEENALLLWLHAEAAWKLEQMFEGRAMARVGDEADPGLAADWMVFADSLRPAPTAPTRPRVWHKGDPEPKFVASVRDADGDVWTRDHRGVWRTPDHGPCGWGYVANRWGPLTEVVECDPAVVDLSLTRSQELEMDAADMETHGGELE